MKFILAKKREMTQKFAEDGTVIPVTKVLAEPCVVTQLKSLDKDGYTSIQIGCGTKNKINKSLKGHVKELGNFRYLKEFRVSEDESKQLAVGNEVTAKVFQSGNIVKVTGISKGKGFQGVVKRHGFHGSLKTHGHKDQVRMPGSIGATGPAHVFKGQRMPGRMGGGQVTVSNLEIIEVDLEKNEIFIKGAVPGPMNNLLLIVGEGDMIVEEEKQDKEISSKQDKEVEGKPVDLSDEALAKSEGETTTEEVKEDKPVEESKEEKSVQEKSKEEKPIEESDKKSEKNLTPNL